MAAFSLAATGNSPWFMLLGRGKLRLGFEGTWAGTGSIQNQDGAGNAHTLSLPGGGVAEYTENSGEVEIDAPSEPIRFAFTRSSGTLTPYAVSSQAPIYFPNADASGNGATFESLPTADPEVSGALWNNSGVVTTSAG